MDDAASIVGKLRALFARGASLRAAEREIGMPEATIRLWCKRHGIARRPPKRLTDAQKRQIRRGLSLDKIDGAKTTLRRLAALAGASKSTVHRLANPTEPGAPRRVRPYRCPGCTQRVILKPCAICAARALNVARPAELHS